MPDLLKAIFGEQQPKPGQGAVRFNPDELREWMNSDDPPTSEDLAKLHPADLRVFYGLEENAEKGMTGLAGMAMGAPAAAMGLRGAMSGAAGLGQKAVALGKEALPYVAPAVGATIGAKMGSPTAGWLMGTLVGGRRFGGRPTPSPAAAVEERAFVPPEISPAATRTNTSGVPGASVKPPSSVTSTTRTTSTGSYPVRTGGVKEAPPNVQRSSPTGPSGLGGEDLEAQVSRGVQNDFRGRVTFEAPGAKLRSPGATERAEFPPGATNRTPPDIFKQLANDHTESLGDPSEVEAIRQFLAEILGKPK